MCFYYVTYTRGNNPFQTRRYLLFAAIYGCLQLFPDLFAAVISHLQLCLDLFADICIHLQSFTAISRPLICYYIGVQILHSNLAVEGSVTLSRNTKLVASAIDRAMGVVYFAADNAAGMHSSIVALNSSGV